MLCLGVSFHFMVVHLPVLIVDSGFSMPSIFSCKLTLMTTYTFFCVLQALIFSTWMMYSFACDTVQVLRQIKLENDPQGMVLQQVVLGSTSADHSETDGASTSTSKGTHRSKDKEQRHRLAKINSAGNNADFMRRNLTMFKISSYVLFGAHHIEFFHVASRGALSDCFGLLFIIF